MSTELEHVVGIDELPPLSERQARALDAKIRSAGVKAAANINTLLTLMDQAATGQAHIALGYPSAGAYFYDAARVAPADTAQRKLLAAIILDHRPTPRVVAEAFNSPPSAPPA